MRYATSYQSIQSPDPDAYWDALTAAVGMRIAKGAEVADVIDDAKRLAYDINREGFRFPTWHASSQDVRDVAEDAVYYAANGQLP